MKKILYERCFLNNYGLNDEQWDAVRKTTVATVVNASAGSGKTRVLIAKILYLLDSGVNPKNILAVTFTNKAAKEMKERLSKAGKSTTGMQVSTLHSLCVRIIKQFVQHTYLKIPFSIYDDGDQQSVVKTIMKARGYKESPYEILGYISKAKSEGREEFNDTVIQNVYNSYQKVLKANNACDFDDLLLLAMVCLKQEDCRNHFLNLWHHILTDESQDTSKIQFDILMALFDPARTKTFFLSGDYNQSIYSFRGARPDNIKDFIEKYKPAICNLTYNYRSCPDVIKHANSYLQFGDPMIAKSTTTGKVSVTEFNSQTEEAEKIAQALMNMKGHEDTAILYRCNARSIEFEKTFAKYRIPYKLVGDIPFYRRRVCKDLLAGLKAAANPQDIESLTRVINNPKRGFGDAKRELLLLKGRPYVEEAAKDMPAIADFLQVLNDIKGQKPLDALNEYLNRTGYIGNLEKDSDRDMVEALRNITAEFETVDDLILASTFLEKDDGKGVQLMTAHASKGLEFDRVFVVGVEQGLWPHSNAEDLDEESRLFYVAITRSKRWLNLSYSRSRLFRGQPQECQPSQFFKRSYKELYGKDF